MLTLEQIKKLVRPICEEYDIDKMYLFGSYARGDATEKSDLDFLIDGWHCKKSWAFGGLCCSLEDVFGLPADVLNKSDVREKFLNAIKKDEVLIYERRERD